MSEFGMLYGAYIALTLGCTFYCLLLIYPMLGWSATISQVLSVLTVVFLFWFQNTYRHDLSPEASAKQEYANLLDAWQIADAETKKALIKQLDFLADSERPWNATDDYDDRDW